MKGKSLESLVDIAIAKEEEAYQFYMNLYDRAGDKEVKDTLQFLANEEKKHKEFLQGYRSGNVKSASLGMGEMIDYRIAEHMEKPDLEKDMSSRDVYLVAAHKELNAFNFYKSLSEIQPAGEVRDMLLRMANEEMKHKEKVEYLYSNTAFPQTQGG